jgi:MFS family permease
MTAKRRVIGIALLTGLAIMGDAMLLIALPIYWEDFGLTAIWQIGVLLSINRFIRLPINPIIGLFYKKFQLRTGLFIAIFLAVLSTFSYGILQQFWLLFIMRAVWGIAWSLLRLGGYLTVLEVAPENKRGNFIGLYNGLWGLGGLVGMLGGGFLVEQTSIFFVTTLFACFALSGVIMILLFVPISAKNEDQNKANTKVKERFTPYIWMVLLTGLTLGFIVFGLFATTLSQLIERSYTTEWTILEITIGAATLAGAIQACKWAWDPFLAAAIGKYLDRSASQINILLVPLLGGGVLLFSLAFHQSIILLIAFLFVFQFVCTMFVTTTDTLATNAAASTSNSIKVITAHTIVVDVGAALGPFVSYLVIEWFDLTTVYIIASLSMLGLALSWFIFKQKTS